MCQLAWLASSSQCKWAHSAASWQSRASDKRMVQTWHTFKKFSLPSPNPLHCKRGWHVPKNWSLCFSVLPSTLRNSGKDHSFPFAGKMLLKGMLCYPSNYVISRESFICREFGVFSVFLTQMALPDFRRIQLKNDRMSSLM